jgi:hypothetical protein
MNISATINHINAITQITLVCSKVPDRGEGNVLVWELSDGTSIIYAPSNKEIVVPAISDSLTEVQTLALIGVATENDLHLIYGDFDGEENPEEKEEEEDDDEEEDEDEDDED